MVLLDFDFYSLTRFCIEIAMSLKSTHTESADPCLDRYFNGHKGAITGLSFNHDSTQLVSSSADSTLMLWNFKKKTRAIKYEYHSESVTGVQFSPSGKLIASCSSDRSVHLWKPVIKPICKSFRAHTSAIRSVAFSSDSTTLLTASNDKNVKMWITEFENKFLSTFHGHTNWVTCARFSLNGQFVVSCSQDKTVKLWDKNSNCCIHTYPEPNAVPMYVIFHPNNKCFGVSYSNNCIKLYDIRSHELIQYYPIHNKAVNQISFHPNGNFIISASEDKTVKVCDLVEGRVVYTLEGHESAVTAVTFSSDGSLFASGGADKKIFVWKTNFDQEMLANPFDSSCNENEKQNEEKPTKTVDANQSISEMEQPEVEISTVQTTKSPELTSPPSLDDINAGGDREHNNNVDNSRLQEVSSTLARLKLDLGRIQKDLNSVVSTVDELERRAYILK